MQDRVSTNHLNSEILGFVEVHAFEPSNEQGQSLIEYLLILSVVVLFSAQISKNFVSLLDRVVVRVGADLERDLKTGRAKLGVWSN